MDAETLKREVDKHLELLAKFGPKMIEDEGQFFPKLFFYTKSQMVGAVVAGVFACKDRKERNKRVFRCGAFFAKKYGLPEAVVLIFEGTVTPLKEWELGDTLKKQDVIFVSAANFPKSVMYFGGFPILKDDAGKIQFGKLFFSSEGDSVLLDVFLNGCVVGEFMRCQEKTEIRGVEWKGMS